jgi:hypothetical protein
LLEQEWRRGIRNGIVASPVIAAVPAVGLWLLAWAVGLAGGTWGGFLWVWLGCLVLFHVWWVKAAIATHPVTETPASEASGPSGT